MTDADDILIHFGVKGMRWGVRKDTPINGPRTISDVNRDLNKIDKTRHKFEKSPLSAEAVIAGYGRRGMAAKKVFKLKRHTEIIDGQKSQKLIATKKTPLDYKSPESRSKYETKINRKAYIDTAIVGYGAVLGLLVGGEIAKRRITNPKLVPYIDKGSKIVAAQQALYTTTTLVGINRAIKLERLGNRELELIREKSALTGKTYREILRSRNASSKDLLKSKRR